MSVSVLRPSGYVIQYNRIANPIERNEEQIENRK